MKRTFAGALLALTTTILTITAGVPSARADAPGSCVEPVPVRSYTHDQLTYRLALDLTDCEWWDRKAIELDAGLERISPSGDGGGAGSFTLCGVRPLAEEEDQDGASADAGDDVDDVADGGTAAEPAPDDSDGPWMRPGFCAVEVSLDHPTLDTAHYKGEVTFPWQGGRRSVSFNAVCQAATGCVDLPADPTTALAPASELYDAISGEHGSVG